MLWDGGRAILEVDRELLFSPTLEDPARSRGWLVQACRFEIPRTCLVGETPVCPRKGVSCGAQPAPQPLLEITGSETLGILSLRAVQRRGPFVGRSKGLPIMR